MSEELKSGLVKILREKGCCSELEVNMARAALYFVGKRKKNGVSPLSPLEIYRGVKRVMLRSGENIKKEYETCEHDERAVMFYQTLDVMLRAGVVGVKEGMYWITPKGEMYSESGTQKE